jgi:hypothetical protein
MLLNREKGLFIATADPHRWHQAIIDFIDLEAMHKWDREEETAKKDFHLSRKARLGDIEIEHDRRDHSSPDDNSHAP